MWNYQEVNWSKFWKGKFFTQAIILCQDSSTYFVESPCVLYWIFLSSVPHSSLNILDKFCGLFLRQWRKNLQFCVQTPEKLKWFETLLSTWSLLMLPLCSAILSLSSFQSFQCTEYYISCKKYNKLHEKFHRLQQHLW